MIHDLDESLRSLLKLRMGADTSVDVVFDAPTKDWASRRNAPTVDLYLYDIREDTSRRHVGHTEQRSEDGNRILSWSPVPRWFKLSYLVTAWTQRPEDEHRLLSMLLAAFLAQDGLPEEVLAGSLAGTGLAIPYTSAMPAPKDRALSDTWSALGGELKPSLDLVVTAPFDLGRVTEAGPPVTEPLLVGIIDRTEPDHDRARGTNPTWSAGSTIGRHPLATRLAPRLPPRHRRRRRQRPPRSPRRPEPPRSPPADPRAVVPPTRTRTRQGSWTRAIATSSRGSTC